MSRVQTYASLWRASWQLRYLVTPEPGVQVSLRIFPPGALAIADEVIEFAIVLCCDCYAGLPLLVGWLGALENTDGMGTHLPKHFGQARLVAHQATDFTTIHVVELVKWTVFAHRDASISATCHSKKSVFLPHCPTLSWNAHMAPHRGDEGEAHYA